MRKNYLFIILSLLVCLFIYLFYRTEKTVINEIVIYIISIHEYAALRDLISNQLPLNKLVIYSLPEALWVFCITLTSKSFYLPVAGGKIDCVFFPLILCVSLEVFQLFHLANGQFDLFDIWLSILFWMIANYFIDYSPLKQNVMKTFDTRSVLCFSSYGIVYLAHVSQ